MNDILAVSGAVSMTSKEIAGLTGKEHKHVIRDIQTMLSQIYDGPSMDHIENKGVLVEKDGRGYVSVIHLDKDHTLTLLTGYDAKARMRVIKRWQELEARQTPALPPMTPSQIGKQCILDMMDVATLFGTPPSYAIQVAASEAVRQTGMPWDRLLTQAAAMSNIPDEDVLLEPTELGNLFDLSAVAMNQKLSDMGLQVKEAGEWRPTDEGQSLCERHAWVRGGKSGYNLKWKAAKIEKMLASH